MSTTKPSPRKTAKALLEQVLSRVLDLEEPLAEATRLVHALRMIGDGMEADGADEGPPIAEVARSAVGRLEKLERGWVGVLRSARAG